VVSYLKDLKGIGLQVLIALFFLAGNLYAQNSADEAFQRGVECVNKGMEKEAIVELTMAIALKPYNAEAYYQRAVAYQVLSYEEGGNIDLAVADFTKAIEINPNHADAYFNRGLAYQSKGDIEWAISDYSKVLEIDPKYAEAYSERAEIYYLRHEYEKAWEDVHKLKELGREIDFGSLEDLKRESGRQE